MSTTVGRTSTKRIVIILTVFCQLSIFSISLEECIKVSSEYRSSEDPLCGSKSRTDAQKENPEVISGGGVEG